MGETGTPGTPTMATASPARGSEGRSAAQVDRARVPTTKLEPVLGRVGLGVAFIAVFLWTCALGYLTLTVVAGIIGGFGRLLGGN